MPRSSALLGESKCTGLPSTRYSPEDGLCTPASVLISVDLPAPLSPSRQCTSPRRRRTVTPLNAITLPKNLLTFSSARMMSSEAGATGAVLMESDIRSPTDREDSLSLRNAAAHIVVEQHGYQQHHPEEHAEPVGRYAGV